MMARQWRRLYAKVVENEDLAMAGEECEFAERLFFRMIATCDDYGRLPGSAFGLQGRACPGVGKTSKQIMEAVEVLAEYDLIERYQVDGKDYIYLPGWFEHQAQKWFATGAPEYPAPPDWEPPESLVEWVNEKRHARGEYGTPIYPPSRYGLDDSILDSGVEEPSSDADADAIPDVSVEASTDATAEASDNATEIEVEVEVEKINNNDRAREANEDDSNDARAEARKDVAFELQRLWPGGVPDDVRDPIMREVNASPPDLAVMVVRRVITEYEHTKFDNWRVRDHVLRAIQKAVREERKPDKQPPKSKGPDGSLTRKRMAELAAAGITDLPGMEVDASE
jgi:hypothetical protein